MNVALGLTRGRQGQELTQPWADQIGAVVNRDWIAKGLADNGPFVDRFHQALARAIARGGRVLFNLDDLSLDEAFAAGPSADPFDVGVTNWELLQVLRNAHYYVATDFFLGGRNLSPEEVIGFELQFRG